MSGETNLQLLLRNLTPTLMEGEYVFCTSAVPVLPARAEAVGTFREAEGTTYILPRQQADELELHYDTVLAWISLEVHSSLEAVGLTATVATVLAEAGISCNVVAAYYHDHLFVPVRDAEKVLQLLRRLTA